MIASSLIERFNTVFERLEGFLIRVSGIIKLIPVIILLLLIRINTASAQDFVFKFGSRGFGNGQFINQT